MTKKTYQICSRCVMDTSDEDIVFDEKGNCNHCESFIEVYKKHSYKKDISEQELENILKTTKERGKNSKYDCLVGISGGVDSSYMAHLCKEYKLRPLLLHLNNGWNTEISEKNVKTMVDKLGFDFEDFVVDWEEFKEIQLAFFRSSIVDIEMPTDLAILGATYKIAAKYKIPTILSGGNFSAEGILPLQWGYHVMNDMKLYRHIVKKYSDVRIKNVPYAGFKQNLYYKFIKGIKTYYPLNYIDFNKDKARSFLMEEYGWENYGGKHHESSITAFLHSYIMPTKYNMDYRCATFSSQIVSGQISREEALRELERPPYDEAKIANDKMFVAQKLGISTEELDSFLKLPPKTYINFPNSKKQIEWFYAVYRRFLG